MLEVRPTAGTVAPADDDLDMSGLSMEENDLDMSGLSMEEVHAEELLQLLAQI